MISCFSVYESPWFVKMKGVVFDARPLLLSVERPITYLSVELPKSKHIFAAIRKIQDLQKEMQEKDREETYYWLRRGEIRNGLKKLRHMLEDRGYEG